MNDFTLNHLIEALQGEPHGVRKYAAFAYATLKAKCPRALATQSTLAKDYLSRRAEDIYEEAGDFDALDALRIALIHVFEFQQVQHPALLPPTLLFSATRQRPIIHEINPPFALQSTLGEALNNALARLHTLDKPTQALVLLLALARQTGITSLTALETLIKCEIQYIFDDAFVASAETDTRPRVLLDGAAIAMHRLLRALPTRALLKSFSKTFKAWWHGRLPISIRLDINEQWLTPSRVLEALSFTRRSPCEPTLSGETTSLHQAQFIQALTGRFVESSEPTLEKRRRKRSTKEFKHFEKLAALLGDDPDRPVALSLTLQHADIVLLDTVRDAIITYEQADTKQSRASSAFKALKLTLLSLIEDAFQDSALSRSALLIALYGVDLTLHGSNNKDKLRMSTITTYLSRLKSFAIDALSDAARHLAS